MIQLIDYLKTHSQGAKYFGLLLVGIILVWSIAGVDYHHAHSWAEKHIPWFWSLFTIGSAAVLIFVAKLVSKNTEASEDYYDK